MNTDEHHSDNDNMIRVEAEFPQKDAYGVSCNFDDSLGIESIKSDKQTGEYFKANIPKRQTYHSIYNEIQGSLISPSSACQPPTQSFGLILKAALAQEEQKWDVVSNREFQYSEDLSRLDKSGVQDVKGNFSSVFSPIQSTNGGIGVLDDKTQIANAEQLLQEENSDILSDEDEITEDTLYEAASNDKNNTLIAKLNKKPNIQQKQQILFQN